MGASLDDDRRRRAPHRRGLARRPAAIRPCSRCRRRSGSSAATTAGPTSARSMASVPDLVAAGATDVHVTLRAFNADPADAPAVFAEIVAPLRRRRGVSTQGTTVSLVLTPFDDYPIHQTALPIAHPATRRPEPLRPVLVQRLHRRLLLRGGHGGVPEPRHHRRRVRGRARRRAAFGVRVRAAFPRTDAQTRIGPLTIDVVEPLRVTRVRADAADLGIDADVTFTARTVALEEPRQTITAGTKTRDGLDAAHAVGHVVGSHLRRRHRTSRSTGSTAPRTGRGACGRSASRRRPRPRTTLPQIFFLWAPINWDDCCTHFLCFERGNGDRFVGSQAVLQLVGDGDPTWGADATARGIEHLAGTVAERALGARACGARRARRCSLLRHSGAEERDRARAAAHVPDARPRLHASRVGTRRAGTASRPSDPRSTRSRSSTTSSRGTSTSSR